MARRIFQIKVRRDAEKLDTFHYAALVRDDRGIRRVELAGPRSLDVVTATHDELDRRDQARSD